MKKPGKSFDEYLIEQLKNTKYASCYFSEILNDYSPGRKERVLLALRRIAKAYGIKSLTKKIGRSPKALYVALSRKGNPTLDTFLSILDALGIQLKASPQK